MNIMLLTTHINVGGIGVYTVNLARYLKKEGHNVTVVSGGGELESELLREGVDHRYVDIRTKCEVSPRVFRALPSVLEIIRAENVDLIHAQTRVAQVISALLEKFRGVPYVTTCHGFFQHRRLSRRLFPCWGRRTVAISKSVERHLIEDLKAEPGRVKQIYNGVELERFSSIGEEKDYLFMESIGLFPEDLIVGGVGRLSPVKGYKYLIRGFSRIASGDASVKLLLVGEGPEEPLLREEVTRNGVQDQVLFFPGGGELEKFLSIMDVFCLPSLHEGLGLSVMEAMAAGRCCIASDVGGISELIQHEEEGLLFPKASPEAVSESLERVLYDRQLAQRLASKARKKALREFSIKDSVKKTIALYEEVLKEDGTV
jgi:glycosyltransferase involved in cell wall biosynthesis